MILDIGDTFQMILILIVVAVLVVVVLPFLSGKGRR